MVVSALELSYENISWNGGKEGGREEEEKHLNDIMLCTGH